MNLKRKHSRMNSLAAVVASLLLLPTLLGCGGDGLADEDLPAASIVLDTPTSFCGGGAGGASLEFDVFSTLVTIGHPADFPTDFDVDRITVEGTVSGLAMGDVVYLVTTVLDTPCEILDYQVVTEDGSGGFVGTVGAGEGENEVLVTAVVFNGAADPVFLCGFGDTCISTMDGAFGAVSTESVAVRLPFD